MLEGWIEETLHYYDWTFLKIQAQTNPITFIQSPSLCFHIVAASILFTLIHPSSSNALIDAPNKGSLNMKYLLFKQLIRSQKHVEELH